MKEKFTTTLDADCKRAMGILAANMGLKRNEWIELIIENEWEKFKNEMEDERNTTRTTEQSSKPN